MIEEGSLQQRLPSLCFKRRGAMKRTLKLAALAEISSGYEGANEGSPSTAKD